MVTNHIDVHHGRTREGKLLVMALNWLYCSCLWRYTSKTWYQELKKRRLFCCYWSGDFLWNRLEWVCECAWNLVETYCSCNFAPRPDGVFTIFTSGVLFFFHFNYMCKFTGIFVSAVITCDKFLCCYWETCRCRSWPSSEPSWIS